jgi:hypothetical protein
MQPVRSPTDMGTIRVLVDGENLPCYRIQCKNCGLDGTGRCVAIKGQSSPNNIAIFIIVLVIAIVFFPTVVGTGLGILMIIGVLLIPVVVLILLGMIGLFSLGILADLNQMTKR